MFSVVLAAAVAFLVTVVLGSTFIEFLQSRKFGQFVREEGPQTHLIKAGTPTMGGVVMLMGLAGGAAGGGAVQRGDARDALAGRCGRRNRALRRLAEDLQEAA